MSKVKLAVDKEKEANKQMVLVIKKYLSLREMTKKELAKRMPMSASTLYKRFDNPGDFRRKELVRIFKVLQMSEEDKKAIPW